MTTDNLDPLSVLVTHSAKMKSAGIHATGRRSQENSQRWDTQIFHGTHLNAPAEAALVLTKRTRNQTNGQIAVHVPFLPLPDITQGSSVAGLLVSSPEQKEKRAGDTLTTLQT